MSKARPSGTGSHASHGAAEASPPVGFDPARIGDLPDRLFVAWIEEADSVPARVLSLLDEAANLLADIRKAAQ